MDLQQQDIIKNKSSFQYMHLWVKFDRFSAWILLLCMFVFFITGYGMTKGIIDSKFATKLHNDILPLVILLSFTIHASYATRLSLIRWQIWNIFTKIIWASIFIVTLLGFVYIDQIYKKQIKTTTLITTTVSSTPSTTTNQSTSNNSQSPTPTSTEKIFTLDELSGYNGLNGKPVYVAVSGVVYDMSSVFVEGSHFSHYAGQELTEEFYSKHVESQITKYPVVGKLK